MKQELLNYNELAAAIGSASVAADHSGLLAAIKSRYPETLFALVAQRSEYKRPAGIIDKSGNRVTDNLVAWMEQQLADHNNDPRAVWQKYKDSGLVKTEWGGPVLHLTAPYAALPDAFYQIEVIVGFEFTSQNMFDPSPWYIPEDRHELISGPSYVFSDDKKQCLSPTHYRLESLVNMRRFLRDLVEVEKTNRLSELPEMQKKVIHIQDIVLGSEGSQDSYDIPFLELCPDWLERVPPAVRFFRDWQESSSGRRGHHLCEHWFAQYNDYTNSEGKRNLYFCPQWADADGGLELPEIMPGHEASPYGVMESLSNFDQQAGYPFAWYFYMLHGNRVSSSAGGVVARAIMDGRINPLPDCDTKVLLRWNSDKYGF